MLLIKHLRKCSYVGRLDQIEAPKFSTLVYMYVIVLSPSLSTPIIGILEMVLILTGSDRNLGEEVKWISKTFQPFVWSRHLTVGSTFFLFIIEYHTQHEWCGRVRSLSWPKVYNHRLYLRVCKEETKIS